MPIQQYMTTPVRSVQESTPLAQVERQLAELRVSGLPVTDAADKPVGVISRTDLLRVGRIRPMDGRRRWALTVPDDIARDVMTEELVTLSPEATLGEAGRAMAKHRIHRVFATENDHLAGVVTPKELMRAIVDKRVTAPMSEHMHGSVVVVKASDPLQLAIDRMAAAHIQGLVVVDDGWPVGVFTQAEALAAQHADSQDAVEDWMSASILCLPSEMPLHRTAAQALATDARRVVAVDNRDVRGILGGLDFARIVKD